MGRIEELNSKIRALNELSNNARQKKEEVINLVKTAAAQLSSGKISRREYYDKLGDALKLKSPEEWIEYYDNYIADCELKIIQCKQLINKESSFGRKENFGKVLQFFVLIVFIAVIISLAYNFGPAMYDFFKNIETGNKQGEGVSTVSGEIYSYKPVSIVSKNPKANFEENTKQGSAAVGENVKWRSEIEMKSSEEFSINIPAGAEIISIKDETGKEIKSIKNLEGGKDYTVEFVTPAPKISKEIIEKNGERVVVSSPIHYNNVYSFVKISKKLNLKNTDKLRLYQIENQDGKETKVPTEFFGYDTDEDGIIDKAEWVTPHLSDAIFEFVIIEIYKAEHLDSSRNFVNDIYKGVKTRDETWSEKIFNGEYVRVYFEQNLTNKNDITIFARSSNANVAEIEVYLKDENSVIAKFKNITSGDWHKTYLINLADGKDYESFDLKVLGEVEFDYIVDPTPTGTLIYYCSGGANSLDSIRNDLSGTYYLAGDIDCAGVSNFLPINGNSGEPFTGILNGNNHKITNLSIDRTIDYVGLFGLVNNANITNLGLDNANISGKDYVGGLAGNVAGTKNRIDNCNVNGKINGSRYIGGLVGGTTSSGIVYINNTYTRINLTSSSTNSNTFSGGLIGYMYKGNITNSFSNSSVSGRQYIGGLVGIGANIGKVNNSYSVSKITGISYAGQLIGGKSSSFKLTNNYAYDLIDSATNCVGDDPSSPGCTMISDNTLFYNPAHDVYDSVVPYWDFSANSIWKSQQPINDYPVFQWQNLEAGNVPKGSLCGAKNKDGNGISCENDCAPGFNYNYINSWGGNYRFYHCYANQNLNVLNSGTLCGFANYNSINGWSSKIIKCNGFNPKDGICPAGYNVGSVSHSYDGITDSQYYCVKTIADSSIILSGTLCGRANYYWSNYPTTPANWIWSSSILCEGYDPKDNCPPSYGRMNSVHHGSIDLDFFCVYNPNNIDYIAPTPADNGIVINNYAEINVSAPIGTTGHLNNFVFNWQGVNYTIYNESLVLIMNFDNNPNIGETSTTAVDVSPYGLTGTLRNSVSWSNDGKFSGCLRSEHITDSEILINGINVNTASNQKNTVSFWMKWDGDYSVSQMPFGWDSAAGYDLILYNADSGGSRCFGFNTGKGDCFGIDLNSNLENKWVYVTAIFSNSPSNIDSSTHWLYINGMKQTLTNHWGVNVAEPRTVTSTVHIGGWGETVLPENTKSYKFGGLIDELRIWNRSLTEAEINESYMSNLKKHNSTQWYFYVNQTKKPTELLASGESYSYYACDKIPNENCTTERSFTVNIDITPPSVTILNPLNQNYYEQKSAIYVTSSDSSGIKRCWGSHDNGITNFSLVFYQPNSWWWGFLNPTDSDGTYIWKAWCEDNVGNIGGSSVTFSIDRTTPQINFTFPTPANNTITASTLIQANVSISEANLKEVKWNWNGTNYTIYNESLVLMMNFDNRSEIGEVADERYNLYGSGSWSQSGLVSYDGTKVNDGIKDIAAFHTDSSAAGSFLMLDSESPKQFSKVNISFFSSSVYAVWDIQYSDDGSKWSTVYTGAGGNPIATGTYQYNWKHSGAHRYWRLYKTNAAQGGGYHSEIQFIEGANIFDVSKNGNNGNCSIVNCPSWVSNGKYNGAYNFDGVNDYINLGNAAGRQGNLPFTISAWVNVKGDTGTNQGIISRGNLASSTREYMLGYSNNMFFWQRGDGANFYTANTLNNKNLNTWYNIVAWYGGSSMKIFINGIEEGTITSLISAGAGTNQLNIGAVPESSRNFFFNGLIDEVRIWNRALSDREIYEQFASNLNKYNQTQWYFYINQSNSSTTNLVSGEYNYFSSAKDLGERENITEKRFIIVDGDFPQINFTFPTPANNTITASTLIQANVSISKANLKEVKWNWNGTNYTIYNESLVLMMNFDNRSEIGEVANERYNLYGSGSWSQSGLVSYDGTKVNDGIKDIAAFHTDSSAAGSFLMLDSESPKQFSKVNISFFSTSVYAVWDIQYSDDGSKWSTVYTGAGGNPIATGTYQYNWKHSGAHRYWRLYKTNAAQGGGYHSEIQFIEGANIFDVSKNGNNGNCSIVNCPSWVSNGKYNGAYNFDGVNDYINLGNYAAMQGNLPFTISAWVNVKGDTGTNQGIISRGNLASSTREYMLGYSGNKFFWQRSNGTAYDILYSLTDKNLNTWYNIVAWYGGSSMKIFINGIEEGTITSLISAGAGTNQLNIGAVPESSRSFFYNGLIDEVRIWNRALSDEEIYEHYVSNLNKHNQTQWYFYINKSNSSTSDLEVGNYSYFASAKDLVDRENITETRFIQIVSALQDIISISSLNSKMTESSVVTADRTLAPGGANKATTFDFYVWSNAGSGALPQGAGITTTNVYVTLVYTGTVPATQPGGKQLTSKGTLCTSAVAASFNTVTGDDISGNDFFGTKTDVVKYTCTVQVPPYVVYGANATRNWDVRAYVEDLSAPTANKEGWEYVDANTGNPFNAEAGHELPIRQTYFNRLEEWKVEPNAADFGSVPFGDPIDKQPTPATQPKIVDLGNVYIDKTQVQASDLQDVDNNDATYIPAIWFFSDPTTPCDTAVAINLDTTLKDVMQNNIAYGPSGNSQDLKICLKKILAGPPAGVTSQTYSTTATGGTAWNADVTFCTLARGLC